VSATISEIGGDYCERSNQYKAQHRELFEIEGMVDEKIREKYIETETVLLR
jgi:hypothetical protein